jgi:hypothetical protein
MDIVKDFSEDTTKGFYIIHSEDPCFNKVYDKLLLKLDSYKNDPRGYWHWLQAFWFTVLIGFLP